MLGPDENRLGDDADLFRQMLDAMPVPVALVDREGRVLCRSSDLEAMFGYTPEDVATESDWWRLAYPDEQYRAQARSAWREEVERAARENERPRPREQVVTCKDGSTRHIEFSSAIVGGNFLVMFRDVTDRRKQEAKVLESEARFRTLAEAAFEGIVISRDGIILDVNRQFLEMTGYARADLIDTPMAEIVAPESRQVAAEATRTRRPYPYGNAVVCKDGRSLVVETRARSVRIGDRLVRITAFRDMTERKRIETELRSTNQSLRALIDSSPLAIITLAADGTVTMWNAAAEAIFGWSSEEAMGRFLPIVPDEKREEHDSLRRRVLSGEGFVGVEVRRVRKDGTPIDISMSMVPMRDASGSVTGVLSISADITERRLAEQAFYESSKILRSVLNTIPAYVFWKNRDSVYLGCSDLFTRNTGLASSDEVAGKTDFDMPWKDSEAESYVADDQAVMASGIPKVNFEETQHTADGTIVNVRVSKIPLRNIDGEIIGVLGTAEDITERKHAEDELALTNEELRTINKIISETAGIADLRSVLNMAVDEALRIVGLEGGTICLIRPDDVFELAVHRATSAETLADIETGQIRVGECLCGMSAKTGLPLILRTKDEVLDFATREALRREDIRFHAAFPLVVEARCVGVLCVFTHTDEKPTERSLKLLETAAKQIAMAIERARLFEEVKRNAEELEQRVAERTIQLESANKELEAFSYSVSHDLRAPLRAIDGFSLVVLEDYSDKVNEEGRRYLARIRSAAVRMGHLIDDILRLSRITRAEMTRGHIDLSEMVRSIAADLIENQPERRVEFTVEPSVYADADANLMRIALENLVGNAWKFTSKIDNARIEFGAVPEQGKKAYYVRDNGAGFDQAYAEKLFGAFQRLHSDAEFPGTGVGLATVKRIIYRHGGKVWAVGEADRGATFFFTLEGGD